MADPPAAMEVERRWIILPVGGEAKELEAAAALLDMAGAEQMQLFQPRLMEDIRRMGTDCRRRGTELVLRWYGRAEEEYAMQGFVEMDAGLVDGLRSAASAVRYSTEPLSDALRLTKLVGKEGVGVRFLPKEDLTEMLVKQSQHAFPVCVPRSCTAGTCNQSGARAGGC